VSENEISYLIRGAIFKIYKILGPGLLESVYISALVYELKKLGLVVKYQVPLPVVYQEKVLEMGFRIDVLVNDLVIIEVKSVETLLQVHHKQVITYLKLSGKKLGILVNFNSSDIGSSIYRKVNKL